MLASNSKILIKINFSYALERLFTNSIKFLIPLYFFQEVKDVNSISLGYGLSFILFTYSGILSGKILSRVANVELISRSIPILFIVISGLFTSFENQVYTDILIFCLAIVSGLC